LRDDGEYLSSFRRPDDKFVVTRLEPGVTKTTQLWIFRANAVGNAPWHASCSILRTDIQRDPTLVQRLHPELASSNAPKPPISRFIGQRHFPFCRNTARNSGSARLIAGTALIASSFLVYLAYPVILLMLPFSPTAKLVAAVTVWFASWGVFSAGVVLAGPEGFAKLKRFCSRVITDCSRTKPPAGRF
jgi:hypothetical protein